MTTKRDYYDILGVSRRATTSDIKKAYRQKALEFHPDRNPSSDAEEKFKEASEAYEVLSDSQKRQIYDQFGHAGLEGRGFHGFHGVEEVFNSFGDIFEEFFGSGFGFGGFGNRGRRRSTNPRRGSDIEAATTVSFMEMVQGISKEIAVYQESRCDTCEGKGSESGKMRHCQACSGSGQIAHSQGFFMIQTTCSHCGGRGEFLADPCRDCRGQGRVRKKKNLNLKVPPGVEEGMHLVLRDEGNLGSHGGPRGDLYVKVRVEPHPFFERRGDDVYCSIPISMTQAALGVTMKVPTLTGEEEIKIPEGIDSGEELRLKKMGIPNIHSGKKGEQIIKIIVKTPKKLSRKQRELLEDFQGS